MPTWKEYKKHVRETNPKIRKDIDEAESISHIVGAMIERCHDLAFSQRDLAELCGLPHSSVARIESGKSTPNLSTLLKIFRSLVSTWLQNLQFHLLNRKKSVMVHDPATILNAKRFYSRSFTFCLSLPIPALIASILLPESVFAFAMTGHRFNDPVFRQLFQKL